MLEVAPNNRDVLVSLANCFVVKTLQQILLYVDRIYVPTVGQMLRDGECIGTTSRSKISDFHSMLDAQHLNIFVRMSKSFCMQMHAALMRMRMMMCSVLHRC